MFSAEMLERINALPFRFCEKLYGKIIDLRALNRRF